MKRPCWSRPICDNGRIRFCACSCLVLFCAGFPGVACSRPCCCRVWLHTQPYLRVPRTVFTQVHAGCKYPFPCGKIFWQLVRPPPLKLCCSCLVVQITSTWLPIPTLITAVRFGMRDTFAPPPAPQSSWWKGRRSQFLIEDLNWRVEQQFCWGESVVAIVQLQQHLVRSSCAFLGSPEQRIYMYSRQLRGEPNLVPQLMGIPFCWLKTLQEQAKSVKIRWAMFHSALGIHRKETTVSQFEPPA